jgi:hypothetical protein
LILFSQPLFEFLNFLLVHFWASLLQDLRDPMTKLGCLTYNPPILLKGDPMQSEKLQPTSLGAGL